MVTKTNYSTQYVIQSGFYITLLEFKGFFKICFAYLVYVDQNKQG